MIEKKTVPGDCGKIIDRGYSFQDVYLFPNESDILSRHEDPRLDLSTYFARGVKINRPIVSANMDTVTEYEMAIAMALYGGIGVLHRAMTAEEEAEQVKIVKAQISVVPQEPILINENASVKDVEELFRRKQRGYVVVVPNNGLAGEFLGIATHRDLDYGEPDDPISKVMTLKNELVSVPVGTTLEEAVKIMKTHKKEKVPVLDNEGLLVGMYTMMDFKMRRDYPNACTDSLGRLKVAGAIGVRNKDNEIKRAHMLVEAGVDALVIDIAHGALSSMKDMIYYLKIIEEIKVPIVAGNVATKETTQLLLKWGADAIKVGIGPGEMCETKNVAGVHVPQITAILSAYSAMLERDDAVPIIADGGVKQGGDVAKAIGAGADVVMIGTHLAGTTESPGEIVSDEGVLKKMVRGMSTNGAREKLQRGEGSLSKNRRRVPEGGTKFVPVQGDVEEKLFYFEGGLRSGMTYVGAHNILEMKQKAKFKSIK